MKKLFAVLLLFCFLTPFAKAEDDAIDKWIFNYNVGAYLTGADEIEKSGAILNDGKYYWIDENQDYIRVYIKENSLICLCTCKDISNIGMFLRRSVAMIYALNEREGFTYICSNLLYDFFEANPNHQPDTVGLLTNTVAGNLYQLKDGTYVCLAAVSI